MHKFPITAYHRFEELPLETFNTFRYAVYILDFNWNYLFVNTFVLSVFKDKLADPKGKNMWTEFPELAKDSTYLKMKADMEKGITSNFIAISPVTNKRQHIVGYRLDDCYYFSSSVLPDKDDLMNELRAQLKK